MSDEQIFSKVNQVLSELDAGTLTSEQARRQLLAAGLDSYSADDLISIHFGGDVIEEKSASHDTLN